MKDLTMLDFLSPQPETEPPRKRRRTAADLQADNRDLERENEALHTRIDILEKIDSVVPCAPEWKPAKHEKGVKHHGIPTLLLSDCHFDEVVDPAQVEGVNAYNREIALIRLHRVVDETINICRKHIAGISYDGMHLMLGGDILSGNIHEELVETNEDTVLGSLDYWSGAITDAIKELQGEFKRLHISGVVGNHGRNTRKPRAKNRIRDNFDWLLYRILAKALAGNSAITWTIPESADCTVKIYDTSFRLSHGDQFRGGNGIAGMLSPLMIGHARKARRQASLGNGFHWLVMGHWHTYWVGKGMVVNGSIKGYDEYAYVSNFDFERPQQALFIVTPEHGLTFPLPIFADDKRKEKW